MNNLWRQRHKYLIWMWILLIPVTVIWWKDSILWVAIMSLYANIEVSVAAWESYQTRKEQNGGKGESGD